MLGTIASGLGSTPKDIEDRTSSGKEPLLSFVIEWDHYPTATFDPTKDCKVEVQEDCGADANLNGDDLACSDGATLDSISYLAFTLSGLPADPIIDKAELRLNFPATAGAAQTVQVCSIQEGDEDWGETTIKCSDHPALLSVLGTITFPTTSGTKQITLPQGVLDYLRDRAGDTDVTLLLVMQSAGESRAFSRREDATASKRPQLKVWYHG